MTEEHKPGEETGAETDGGAVESETGLATLFGGDQEEAAEVVEKDVDRPASAEEVVGGETETDYRLLGLAVLLTLAGVGILAAWRLDPALIGSERFLPGLAAGASLGLALLAVSNATSEEPVRLPDPEVVDAPRIVDPPESGEKQSRLGVVGKLLGEYRTRRKRKRLGGKGYVEWYLIEDGWPRPKFIKPKIDATNLPYYKYKGERYFFPRLARLADERGGVWVVVHQRGDADPINLTEPKPHSIPAEAVEKWANLVVQTREGLLGGLFDRDPQDLFKLALYGFIGYMVVRTALQNGVIPF